MVSALEQIHSVVAMDNIYTAFRPFYIAMKVLGIFPVSFEGPARKGILRQTFSDIFLSCISIIPFITLFVVSCSRQNSMDLASQILPRAWSLSNLFCLTMLVLSYSYQIAKRGSIIKFLELLEGFDKEV